MKISFTFLLLILLPVTILSQNLKVSDPVKLLSNSVEYFNSPVYSPDGNKIAFTSSNYKGIYIFDVISKNYFLLTNEDAAGFGIKWDNISQNILSKPARFENEKRYNTIKIFDINSKQSKQLCDYRSFMPGMPSYNADNSQVYICSRGIFESFNSGLASSPDSKNLNSVIAYIKDDKIVVNSLSENAKIFEVIQGERVINLTLSPNGQKVAFEIIGGNMFSMNIDGTQLVDLGKGNRPRWSSDNQHITYQISKDDGSVFTESDIFVIQADGSFKQNLTDTKNILEMNPCFAPDNKSIVFDIPSEGAIYSMNILIN